MVVLVQDLKLSRWLLISSIEKKKTEWNLKLWQLWAVQHQQMLDQVLQTFNIEPRILSLGISWNKAANINGYYCKNFG